MNAGSVVLVTVYICTAIVFLAIGIWAGKRKDPMHFYSGKALDPKTITDIPAYNRENGRMWMLYSIPYWLCGVLTLIEACFHSNWLEGLILVIMVLAATAGLWWLVKTYTAIAKKYATNPE